jgi:hypothetical protein
VISNRQIVLYGTSSSTCRKIYVYLVLSARSILVQKLIPPESSSTSTNRESTRGVLCVGLQASPKSERNVPCLTHFEKHVPCLKMCLSTIGLVLLVK